MREEHLYPSKLTFVAVMKACVKLNDQEMGLKVNAAAVKLGMMEKDFAVVSGILSMYLSFNWTVEAQQLCDKLPYQNVVLWTTLITFWVKKSCGEEALDCFERMQLVGMRPDAVTFVSGLKACSLLKFLEKGVELHVEIERRGFLGSNLALGNVLVHMYAKCGLMPLAQEVFDFLPRRNVASWTTLITGYADADDGVRALKVFGHMQQNTIAPNEVTYACILKACSISRKPIEGRQFHIEIEAKNLRSGNNLLGNALVDMYAKCGLLTEAQQLFDKYILNDIVSWNILMGSYIEHGRSNEVLWQFKKMHHHGVTANAVTFVLGLRACGNTGAVTEGLGLHCEIARKGSMERDIHICNALVELYAHCALLDKAQEVFDKLQVRDTQTWTTLISGYAEHGQKERAIYCFQKMKSKGVSPDAATNACCLKVYVSMGAMSEADKILADLEKSGAKGIETAIGTFIVDTYAKQGFLEKSLYIFDKLCERNIVSWNSLVAGYVEHGKGVESLYCLEQMQLEGVSPNAITFLYALKSCGTNQDIIKGVEIHCEISRRNLLNADLHVGSTLVAMYANCGALGQALEVFEEVRLKTVILWNVLIGGFVENGCGEQALELFESMQSVGVVPDLVTFTFALKACGIEGASDKGYVIHMRVLKIGMLENDTIANVLVDMYAKCGMLSAAQDVFDGVSNRSIVTYNSMLVGYVEHGQYEGALQCFGKMQPEGVTPNYISFTYLLKACGALGAVEKGRESHVEIERLGLCDQDLVGSGLLDLYTKCGSLDSAQEVFDRLPCRSIISWNLLISGYAELRDTEHALVLFRQMINQGLKPDCVTFVVVLNACSRKGLHCKGQTYFTSMSEDYGLLPTLEHHTCMVNLLTRTGDVGDLVSFIKRMPSCPDLALWRSVLIAFIKWGNVDLARFAFQHALCFDEEDATVYVLMANAYASDSNQTDRKYSWGYI